MRNFTPERLESRTLMSAATLAALTADPAVKADRLAVRADLLKFRADAAVGSAALYGDLAALKAAHVKTATTLTAPIAQLRADLKATALTLRIDRLTQSQAVLTDELAIVTELKQALADRGDATAEAADKAALLTLRSKLQADDVAGLGTRIATRTTAQTTIFSDVQAIVAVAGTDPATTPALQSAVAKFAADRAGKLTTLTADLTKLSADRQQLSADLAAEAASGT